MQVETIINKTKQIISEKLMPIINSIGEPLEGNIFMKHHTSKYTDVDFHINKVNNICIVAMDPNVENVLEIGFNAGFSTLLMLLSNENLKITCVDICSHQYTIPCYEILKTIFGDRIHLIPGDSMKTLPSLNDKYDLIHIDGCHEETVAESDILESYRLCKKSGGIMIMDDYNFPILKSLWDKYCDKWQLKKYDSPGLKSTTFHDICVVL